MNRILLVLFAFLSTQVLLAQTYVYVNDATVANDKWCTAAGSTSGDGSIAAPYATISQALAVIPSSANSYVIRIDNGSYEDNITVSEDGNVSNKFIIEGASKNHVIIEQDAPQEELFHLSAANHVEVRNITFQRTSGTVETFRISSSSDNNVIHNCSINNATSLKTVTIETGCDNNTFYDNAVSKTNADDSSSCIEITEAVTNLVIRNCSITMDGSNYNCYAIKTAVGTYNSGDLNSNHLYYDNIINSDGGGIHIQGDTTSSGLDFFQGSRIYQNEITLNNFGENHNSGIRLEGCSDYLQTDTILIFANIFKGGENGILFGRRANTIAIFNNYFSDNVSGVRFHYGSTGIDADNESEKLYLDFNSFYNKRHNVITNRDGFFSQDGRISNNIFAIYSSGTCLSMESPVESDFPDYINYNIYYYNTGILGFCASLDGFVLSTLANWDGVDHHSDPGSTGDDNSVAWGNDLYADSPNDLSVPLLSAVTGDISLGQDAVVRGVDIRGIERSTFYIGAASDALSCGAAPDAGDNASICAGTTFTTSDATCASGNCNWILGSDANGDFSSASTLNGNVFTPSRMDTIDGVVSLTLFSDEVFPCPDQSDDLVLTITPTQIVDAGANDTICIGETINFTDATSNGTSFAWVTDGNGALSNETNLAASYTAVADDTSGAITFTLTSSEVGCVDQQDTRQLVVMAGPSAYAGTNDSVCSIEPYTLLNADTRGSVVWSSSGDGTFNSTKITRPRYTPGETDAGVVTLTVIASRGACTNDTSSMNLTVVEAPSVYAGSDVTICNNGSYQVNDATAENGTILWTSDGDGVISAGATTVSPIYEPDAADVGIVTLTMTVSKTGCSDVSDIARLKVNAQPTVGAGDDTVICVGSSIQLGGSFTNGNIQWEEVEAYDGSLSSTTITNPVFTPSLRDTGVVYLSSFVERDGCSTARDTVAIQVNTVPSLTIGQDLSQEGRNFNLSIPEATNYSRVAWTSKGNGVFNDTSLLNPIYTVEKGYKLDTLYLTVFGQEACDVNITDSLYLVRNTRPAVFIGNDQSICDGQTVTFTKADTANSVSIKWWSNAGSFNDLDTIHPSFTPNGPGEYLIVASSYNADSSIIDHDTARISVERSVILKLQNDEKICGNEHFEPRLSVSNYDYLQWSASIGSVQDSHIVESTVRVIDSSYQTKVYVTAYGNGVCESVTDSFVLSVQAAPMVNAGRDSTFCEGDAYTVVGSDSSNVQSVMWQSNEIGQWNDVSLIAPRFTIGQDVSSVALTIKAMGVGKCQFVEAQDALTLTVRQQPTVNSGSDRAFCATESISVVGASVNNAASSYWTHNGEGSFVDSTVLNVVYQAASNDGMVDFYFHATANKECEDVIDTAVMTIHQEGSIVVAERDSICANETIDLASTSASQFTSYEWTALNGGYFSDAHILQPIYTPAKGVTRDTLIVEAKGAMNCSNKADTMFVEIQSITDASFSYPSQTYCNTGVDPVASIVNVGGEFVSSSASLVLLNDRTGLVDLSLTSDGDYNLTYTTDGVCPDTATFTLSVVSAAPIVTLTYDESTYCKDNAIDPLPNTNEKGIFRVDTNIVNTWVDSISGAIDVSAIPAGSYTVQHILPDTSGCTADTAFFALTIDSMVLVSAGLDSLVCSGVPIQLNGARLEGTPAASNTVTWSGGEGSFANANSNNAVYTPHANDYAKGNVKLFFQGSDPDGVGGCQAGADSVVYTFIPDALANAGQDDSLCENLPIYVSGQVTRASNYYWETEGSGSFADSTLLQAVYTPSLNDYGTGYVLLNLYVISESGCDTVVDQVRYDFVKPPEIELNTSDTTLCIGDTLHIGGTVAEEYVSILWKARSGTFTQTTVANPSYIGNTHGQNYLVLTGEARYNCIDAIDSIAVFVQEAPSIIVDTNRTRLCAGELTVLDVFGMDTTHAVSLLWVSKSGFMTDANTLVPNYTATEDLFQDRIAVTANAKFGCEDEEITLIINKYDQPELSIDAIDSICLGTTINLMAEDSDNIESIIWSNLQSGVLSNANQLSTNYQSMTLIDDTVIVEATSPYGCTTLRDSIIIKSLPLPRSGVPHDTLLCAYDTIEITVHDSLSYSWSNGQSGVRFTSAIAGVFMVTMTDSVGCQSNDSLVLINAPILENYAGPDIIACDREDIVLNNAIATGEYYWSSATDGQFVDSSLLVATYAFGGEDSLAGKTKVYLTSQNACDTLVDELVVKIDSNVTIDVGPDLFICKDDTVQLNYVNAAGDLLWTTDGDGSFNDSSLLHPEYVPGPNDISNGLAVITLRSETSCGAAANSLNLFIAEPVEVYAGPDVRICDASPYRLEDATGVGTLQWSTSGEGRFSSDTVLVPVYLPDGSDITNGQVWITLTSTGRCGESSDSLLLQISDTMTVFAGNDNSICADKRYRLTEANGHGDLTWSTSGDGMFDDVNFEHPIYSPGSADVANGSVNLYLTSQSTCDTVTDSLLLMLGSRLVVDAGPNQYNCGRTALNIQDAIGFGAISWSTSGSGSFVKGNTKAPIYYPSIQDSIDGFVTLVMTAIGDCDSVSDSLYLYISNQAVVDAGSDLTVCPNLPIQLNESSANGVLTWSTSGTGTFVDAHDLHPVYYPSESDTGELVLTLTANTNCGIASDSMVLSYYSNGEPYAGPDAQICLGSEFTTNGWGVGNVQWTTSGNGKFDNDAIVNAKYFYGSNDSIVGSVKLTLTQTSVCGSTSDEMTLILDTITHVVVPTDSMYACAGEAIQINGVLATGTLAWSTNGSGTLNYANTYEPEYIPSADDISEGQVDLTVVNETKCALDSATIELFIVDYPVVDLGPDQEICTNGNILLNPSSTPGVYEWTSTGDGVFTSTTSLQTYYNPGDADRLSRNVQLRMAVSSTCGDTADVMELVLSDSPSPTIMDYAEVCAGDSTLEINGSSALGSITWSSDGDGSFNSVYLLNPEYTPGEYDYINERIWLTLTAETECGTFNDSMMLGTATPEIEASPDTTINPSSMIFVELEIFSNFSNAYTYDWQPSEYFDDPTAKEPQLSGLTEDTDVTITIESSYGCVRSDTLEIKVEEGKWGPFLPSAFTPNGDGNNDLFFVSLGDVDELNLIIYNRNGEIMYNRSGADAAWDGTYGGKEMGNGTYMYVVTGSYIDGDTFYKKGKFLLLR